MLLNLCAALFFFGNGVFSSTCGNLQFSSSTVRETESVQLTYSYATGYRYEPRLWYRLRGKQWTKIYDSTYGPYFDQDYQERFYDNTYILTLPSVSLSDAGDYIVRCSTFADKLSQSAVLKVLPQSMQQGICGRLEILSNGSPVGSWIQFKFETSSPQTSGIIWQREVSGNFRGLDPDPRVEQTWNNGMTLFARKFFSQASDVGVYRVRCNDGTVSNIVELAVHVIPPGKPEILGIRSYPGCDKCLLALPDKYLTINCTSYNGSAPVDLKLYFKNRKVNQAVSLHVTHRRVSVIHQQLTQDSDENAVIKCTASNSAVDKPVETAVQLYMFKEPSKPVISSFKGTEGKLSTITCRSTGGKPAPSLTFLYNRTVINPEIKTIFNVNDGTIEVDAKLYINLTRSDNLREIQCRSEILESRKFIAKSLSVKFPPKEVKVTEVKRASNSQGHTNLTVRCLAGESNPQSTVIWQSVDTIARASDTDNNKGTVGNNGGWTFQHDLNLTLTKKDNQKTIKCVVLNDEFPQMVLEKSFKINILYEPIIQIVGGPNITAFEGSDTRVTCQVDSNPGSKIRWLKDGVLIAESDNPNNSKLTMTLYNISTHNDSSVFTCSAENGVGNSIQQNCIIFVKDKSLAIRTVSGPDGNEGTIAAVLGVLLFVIVMVTVMVIVIRRKRKLSNSSRPSGVQIHIENRQPSIHPPVDEPVYNNVTLPGLLVSDDSTVYAKVESTSQQNTQNVKVVHQSGTEDVTVPGLSTNDEPAVYAKVIPKSQLNTKNVKDNNQSDAEYAVVIPKSQRKPMAGKLEGGQQNEEATNGASNNLVYAELDLNPVNEGSDATNKRSLNRQESLTQYITIDFNPFPNDRF